jgi:hypothetical protein
MSKQITFKNVRKNRYTQMDNAATWDKELTLQAKGLLLIFLSNKGDWDLHMKEIITRSKNGRDAHYKVVDELIEKGYFARIEIRNEKNQFEEMIYAFSDNKQDVLDAIAEYADHPHAYINLDKKKKNDSPKQPGKKKNPYPENQETENQDTKNQFSENQDINNTNPKNTNSNNINQNNNNLSIYKEEIHNSKLPDSIKLALNNNKIDRLIYHNISVSDLFTNYELHKNSVNPGQYISALDFALAIKDKIKDFAKVMNQNINNQIKFANSNQNVAVNTGRKEMVPDWLKAKQEAAAAKEESGADQQALTIEQLEKVAQWYKDGHKDVNPQLMEQILQLGLLEESDL